MTKLRVWDRILSALMGILCILAAAAIVLYAVGWLSMQQIKDVLASLTGGLQVWMRWGIFAVAILLLVLLGLHGIGVLFRKRKDKGFVVQHTEYGDMNISIKALENMVKKCVDAHSELTANYTRIYLVRNGVSMDMKVTLAAGVNIPLTVNALQKQIKQYVTSCSGVEVYEVRVKVETDAVKLLPPPSVPIVEPERAVEVKHVEAPAEISEAEPVVEAPAAETVVQEEAPEVPVPEEKIVEESVFETPASDDRPVEERYRLAEERYRQAKAAAEAQAAEAASEEVSEVTEEIAEADAESIENAETKEENA